MVTPCRTSLQIPCVDVAQINDNSARSCVCPCQLSPPINEYTYCVLKRLCRKILKDICQEQSKEKYSVFDGGSSMKDKRYSWKDRDDVQERNSMQFSRQSSKRLRPSLQRICCSKGQSASDNSIKKRGNGRDFRTKKTGSQTTPVTSNLRKRVRDSQSQNNAKLVDKAPVKNVGQNGKPARLSKTLEQPKAEVETNKAGPSRKQSLTVPDQKNMSKNTVQANKAEPEPKPAPKPAPAPAPAPTNGETIDAKNKKAAQNKAIKKDTTEEKSNEKEHEVKKTEQGPRQKPESLKTEHSGKLNVGLKKIGSKDKEGKTKAARDTKSSRSASDKLKKNEINNTIQNRKSAKAKGRSSMQNMGLMTSYINSKKQDPICSTPETLNSERRRNSGRSRMDAVRPCDHMRLLMENKDIICCRVVCDPCTSNAINADHYAACPPCPPCDPCDSCQRCDPCRLCCTHPSCY